MGEKGLWKPQTVAKVASVTLHVYDFLEQGFNGLLRQVGTGGFHCGVEVLDKEWSFRRTLMGTGVFWIHPKSCTAHKYRESVAMGQVLISEEKFLRLIGKLKKDWPGNSYDILRKNCCIFSNELCIRLGVGPIPAWITNLAGVGADLRSMVRRPLRHMEAVISPELPPETPSSPAQGGVKVPRARRAGYEKLPPPPPPAPVSSTICECCGVEVHASRTALRNCCLAGVASLALLVVCCVAAITLRRLDVPWVDKAAPGGQESLTSKFNCSVGYAVWEATWLPDKQSWCCVHAGRACPGSSNASSQQDCQAETAEQVAAWSLQKRDWCCQRERFACPSAYSCEAKNASEALDWPEDQRAWCCERRRVGCGVAAPAPAPDCRTGDPEETQAWPAKKRAWCCEHESTACPRQYDCRADNVSQVSAWSAEQQAWCCEHERFACPTSSNNSNPDAIVILPLPPAHSLPPESPSETKLTTQLPADLTSGGGKGNATTSYLRQAAHTGRLSSLLTHAGTRTTTNTALSRTLRHAKQPFGGRPPLLAAASTGGSQEVGHAVLQLLRSPAPLASMDSMADG